MKIGNLKIGWHKHECKKVVVYADEKLPSSLAAPGYLLKVAEQCVTKDCDCGSFRSVYYIYLKNKPEVVSID